MNICEVLVASLADERTGQSASGHVHRRSPLPPWTIWLRFQSTNDTFSTSVILMSFRILEEIWRPKNSLACRKGLVARRDRVSGVVDLHRAHRDAGRTAHDPGADLRRLGGTGGTGSLEDK